MQVIRNGIAQRRRGVTIDRRRVFSAGGPYDSLRSGLTAQWKLNEASGNALDSVGGYDLTQNGTAGSTTGIVGNCRTFDETCYFNRTAEAALMPLGVDFSYSTWFYITSSGRNQGIFTLRNAGSADGNLLWILRDQTTNITAFVGDGVGGFSSTTVGVASLSTWYHFACSFRNSTKELRYRWNGGAATSFTSTYAPTTSPATPKIAIGGDVLELALSGTRIDCTKLWIGRVLSDADLLLDYNAGAGVEL